MCLALIALAAHPRLPLVIAANRDEFHERAALPAYWWPSEMLAGMDRVAGGTWFGVDHAGRWALVTNYREGVPRDPNAPSRGELVTRALSDSASPLVTTAAIVADGDRYHGFNLLIGEGARAAYASNRASGAIALQPGVHGLSNHLLETPWPKVVRSKARLTEWLGTGSEDLAPLFELLADRAQADATALPSTGVAPEWERLLSSPFIVDARYGTRCSTVLAISLEGNARFIERSFDREGRVTGEVGYEFGLEPRRAGAHSATA
ncbi:MAG TPA: NRDE family protein [Casimicrobiaceae bacterium]|nr:NRDE family protein [Casimicrobiaceae bacterium]